jgi:hypothetical protein
MWETIIVVLIVAAAVLFLFRSSVRTAKGTRSTCGCGVDACPIKDECASDSCEEEEQEQTEREGRHHHSH